MAHKSTRNNRNSPHFTHANGPRLTAHNRSLNDVSDWVRKAWVDLKKVAASELGVIHILNTNAHQYKGPLARRPKAHANGKKHKYINLPSNHMRVVIGRALRMHISIAEYKRRFPKGGKSGQA